MSEIIVHSNKIIEATLPSIDIYGPSSILFARKSLEFSWQFAVAEFPPLTGGFNEKTVLLMFYTQGIRFFSSACAFKTKIEAPICYTQQGVGFSGTIKNAA